MGGMWGLRFSSLWVLNVKDGSRLKLVLTGTYSYISIRELEQRCL